MISAKKKHEQGEGEVQVASINMRPSRDGNRPVLDS